MPRMSPLMPARPAAGSSPRRLFSSCAASIFRHVALFRCYRHAADAPLLGASCRLCATPRLSSRIACLRTPAAHAFFCFDAPFSPIAADCFLRFRHDADAAISLSFHAAAPHFIYERRAMLSRRFLRFSAILRFDIFPRQSFSP